MIALERHIEILLLWNDCVIVPGFGGFTASHVPARFDENDSTFIPPLRTLGFNPKLNINDSLLAQSYTDTYDISYPDALKRIAEQAEELRQHIYNEGSYTLNDIGTLYLTENGNIGFTPCEAGVLTPLLYSLSSFEMHKLADTVAGVDHKLQHKEKLKQPAETIKVDTTTPKQHDETAETTEEETDNEEQTVSIKLSVLRNVAAVLIAIIGFFALSTPVNNSTSTVQMSQMEYGIIQKLMSHKATPKVAKAFSKEFNVRANHIIEAQPTEMKSTDKMVEDKTATDYFCLVLASRVTLRNAEAFAKQLADKGYRDARVLREKGKALKVVFGNYKTEAKAYNALNDLHGEDVFHDAWVYNVK